MDLGKFYPTAADITPVIGQQCIVRPQVGSTYVLGIVEEVAIMCGDKINSVSVRIQGANHEFLAESVYLIPFSHQIVEWDKL